MTEFIINSDQLERIIEAVEHDTGREVNRVIIDGERIPVIVRCRDCKHYNVVDEIFDGEDDITVYGCWLLEWKRELPEFCEPNDPDGYCAWGERRSE